jgi:hypothetical protein
VLTEACGKVPIDNTPCTGSIVPGSVQITLVLTSPDAEAAAQLRDALQPLLNSTEAASAFFGLRITEIPTITSDVASPPSPPSTPPLGPEEGGATTIIVIVVTVVGGLLLIIIIIVAIVCWRRRGCGRARARGRDPTPRDTYKVEGEAGDPVLVARM